MDITNKKTNENFEIFGTKETEDGIIMFLVYDYPDWEWVPAAEFKPYN